MIVLMVANNTAAVWNRTFEPLGVSRSSEAARTILDFKFAKEDVDRMNELAAIAREGMLTAEQKAEADNYSRLAHMLAILQSKARQALGIKRTGTK